MRRLVFALVLLALALPAAARRRAVSVRPYPDCSMVTGTAAVTFTRDEGRTLAPSAEAPRPISYTYGLAASLEEPDTLFAWHGDDLLVSKDAGCSWRVEATVPGADFPPRLTPARGGRVYAWSDNRHFLVRYDARGAKSLKQPVDFVGFGADPVSGEHLRAGGVDGSIWESLDGGESWEPLGRIEATNVYRVIFDPNDLDHVVAGTMVNGAHVSRDGGKTWTRATGISARDANVFELAISPVDGSRVWAMGIDLSGSGRHIFVSSDGGATYEKVITEEAGVKLVNGPTMAAHPTNRDVFYFVFGTFFQGYGTDLFRYDLATRELTMTHNGSDDINAIVFSRRMPSLMYLGVESMD